MQIINNSNWELNIGESVGIVITIRDLYHYNNNYHSNGLAVHGWVITLYQSEDLSSITKPTNPTEWRKKSKWAKNEVGLQTLQSRTIKIVPLRSSRRDTERCIYVPGFHSEEAFKNIHEQPLHHNELHVNGSLISTVTMHRYSFIKWGAIWYGV